MSSPEQKKTKNPLPLTKQSTRNPSLPEDLLLNCVARVSRLHYRTLSLVSKSFRSLLASPALYEARSLIGHTESCLYVCLHFYSEPCYRWFTLCRKPNQTLTNGTGRKKKKKLSSYVLARVPIPHSPDADSSGLVAADYNIYNIAGSIEDEDEEDEEPPCFSVSILDCRFHTWRESQRLWVGSQPLTSVSASIVDRKIYVAGSYEDVDSDSLEILVEVFDTKNEKWDPDPVPINETHCNWHFESTCVDGQFHVVTDQDVVAYDSKEGRWDLADQEISRYMFSDSHCEIDNVLYSASDRTFMWYDNKLRTWKELKGLVGLPKFPPNARITLGDYGGKMAVLWDEELSVRGDSKKSKIWCAEIALERRESCEIWGEVEWFDHVLTVPGPFDFVKVISATV